MSAKTESGHDLKPTMTLDMRGTSCPAPLLGAKRLIDAMKPVYARFASTPKLKDMVRRIQETK